jgi:hypothetical protein
MKKIKVLFIMAVLGATIASCSHSRPILITDNPSEKTGTTEMDVILGIFRPMKGDLSIQTAAKNGGITKVSTVDFIVKSKIFKVTYQTVVTGS